MSVDLLDQLTKRETVKEFKAAVTWVIDVTGSMGSEIGAVRDTLLEFANIFEKRGVRLDLGLVSFRDLTIGEDVTTHSFGGKTFTRDANEFRSEIKSALVAGGGGPTPESSYEAMIQACNLEWPQGADRTIVLITDAPPHTSSPCPCGQPCGSIYDSAEVKKQLDEANINLTVLTYVNEEDIRESYRSCQNPMREPIMFDLGNKDKSSLIKTIRNIGLNTSERTGKSDSLTE